MKQRVPDVLVATPGRLVDLLENEGLDVMLRSLRVLVYDEADQLLALQLLLCTLSLVVCADALCKDRMYTRQLCLPAALRSRGASAAADCAEHATLRSSVNTADLILYSIALYA
eukprot:3087-Heterococcus_DN1.PRE.2